MQMLCADPSEVYDRLTTTLTNAAVISGLVMSSICGPALEPLDPEEFPESKQRTAEVFNVTASLTCTIQAAGGRARRVTCGAHWCGAWADVVVRLVYTGRTPWSCFVCIRKGLIGTR